MCHALFHHNNLDLRDTALCARIALATSGGAWGLHAYATYLASRTIPGIQVGKEPSFDRTASTVVVVLIE